MGRSLSSDTCHTKYSNLQGALAENGVKIYGGERASHALSLTPAEASKKEYGSNELTLELVSSLDEAVLHIHEHGSSHTEAIITGQSVPDCTFAVSGRFALLGLKSLPQHSSNI